MLRARFIWGWIGCVFSGSLFGWLCWFPAGFYSVSTLFHSLDGSDTVYPLLIRCDPLIVQFSVQGTQYIGHGKLMKILFIGKADPHTL